MEGWLTEGKSYMLYSIHGAFGVEDGKPILSATTRPPARVQLHAGASQSRQANDALSCTAHINALLQLASQRERLKGSNNLSQSRQEGSHLK